MRFVKLLVVLMVAMFGVLFAVMNAQSVGINYYYGVAELPLSLLLVLAMAVGSVLGVLVTLGSVIRLKGENASLRRKAVQASQEVNNLRAIPLKD